MPYTAEKRLKALTASISQQDALNLRTLAF